jgi:hypothetical protein
MQTFRVPGCMVAPTETGDYQVNQLAPEHVITRRRDAPRRRLTVRPAGQNGRQAMLTALALKL